MKAHLPTPDLPINDLILLGLHVKSAGELVEGVPHVALPPPPSGIATTLRQKRLVNLALPLLKVVRINDLQSLDLPLMISTSFLAVLPPSTLPAGRLRRSFGLVRVMRLFCL